MRGVDAIQPIFGNMFDQLADCRFRIVETVSTRGAHCSSGTSRSASAASGRRSNGASTVRRHLRFDATGRVVYHRDYWDAADELYAKLPLLGPVMRFLKRRLG